VVVQGNRCHTKRRLGAHPAPHPKNPAATGKETEEIWLRQRPYSLLTEPHRSGAIGVGRGLLEGILGECRAARRAEARDTHAVLSCGAARAGLVLADTITVIVPCPRHPRHAGAGGTGRSGVPGGRVWAGGGAPGVIFSGSPMGLNDHKSLSTVTRCDKDRKIRMLKTLRPAVRCDLAFPIFHPMICCRET